MAGWSGALRRLVEGALDLLFPLRCTACGREGAWVCPACRPSLPVNAPPLCPRCAHPGPGPCPDCAGWDPALAVVRAPYRYEGPVREALLRLKYRGVRALAPPLAEAMALACRGLPADALVPVPLHPRRRRERGYNQSALLARALAPLLGVPVAPVLVRVRPTPPLAGQVGARERWSLLEGAFRCQGPAPRRALLVDDVCTTGATLVACARALWEGGAEWVGAVVVAREPAQRRGGGP